MADRSIILGLSVGGGITVLVLAAALFLSQGGDSTFELPERPPALPTPERSYEISGEAADYLAYREQVARGEAPDPPADTDGSLPPWQDTPKIVKERERERHPLDWSRPPQEILRAIEAIESGKTDTAKELAGEFLNENPTHVMGHHTYARMLWEQGKIDEALAHIREAANRYPDVPGLRYVQALVLVNAGRQAEAAKALDAYLEGNEDDEYADSVRVLRDRILQRNPQ